MAINILCFGRYAKNVDNAYQQMQVVNEDISAKTGRIQTLKQNRVNVKENLDEIQHEIIQVKQRENSTKRKRNDAVRQKDDIETSYKSCVLMEKTLEKLLQNGNAVVIEFD